MSSCLAVKVGGAGCISGAPHLALLQDGDCIVADDGLCKAASAAEVLSQALGRTPAELPPPERMSGHAVGQDASIPKNRL